MGKSILKFMKPQFQVFLPKRCIITVFEHIRAAVEPTFLHNLGWVPHFGPMSHEAHHSECTLDVSDGFIRRMDKDGLPNVLRMYSGFTWWVFAHTSFA